MDIRPQDLPELRVEIVESLLARSDDSVWERLIADGLSPFRDAPRIPSAAEHVRFELLRIRHAELFHVSAEMSQLAKTAAETLPPFQIEPQDLPAPHGFLIFGDAIETVPFGQPEVPSPVVGACWMTVPIGGKEVVWISFYSTRETSIQSATLAGSSPEEIAHNRRVLPRLTQMLGADMRWPFNCEGRSGPKNDTAMGLERAAVALRSTWLLMAQPLASSSQIAPDRAARKRLARAGHEPAPVRVIELRRPKTTSGHGDSDREYHHQWIVRGHWRQQWHPKRQVHRPVWIAPHIKGPEGAPLIGGEKVYALKR